MAATDSCKPVTRFAPSPTGRLHLGHAHAAIVAWRAARAAGGRFLLRIEDIDPSRCRPEFTAGILEDLAWLGLDWDGPVRVQSAHLPAYRAALDTLAARGLLYPCFCTRAEIAREIAAASAAPHAPPQPSPLGPLAGPAHQPTLAPLAGPPHGPPLGLGDGPPLGPPVRMARGPPQDPAPGQPPTLPAGLSPGPDGPRYPGTCRTLPAAARAARIAAGTPYALRLDMAAALRAVPGPLHFHERGQGCLTATPEAFGDVVLARKDSPASYHLCVTHDDAAQGVTLVTRGIDLLPATSLHRLLQALFGWPVPEYAHHPLLLGADGRRLAKREGAPAIADLRSAGHSAATVHRMAGFLDGP